MNGRRSRDDTEHGKGLAHEEEGHECWRCCPVIILLDAGASHVTKNGSGTIAAFFGQRRCIRLDMSWAGEAYVMSKHDIACASIACPIRA